MTATCKCRLERNDTEGEHRDYMEISASHPFFPFITTLAQIVFDDLRCFISQEGFSELCPQPTQSIGRNRHGNICPDRNHVIAGPKCRVDPQVTCAGLNTVTDR